MNPYHGTALLGAQHNCPLNGIVMCALQSHHPSNPAGPPCEALVKGMGCEEVIGKLSSKRNMLEEEPPAQDLGWWFLET